MDFSLPEELEMLRDMVRDFASEKIAPFADEWDEKHYFPYEEVVKPMGELGLFGMYLPEKYGGLGMDYISLGLACEELEYGDTSARVVLSVHIGLYSLPVCTWGNEAQKEKYLIPCAKGDKIATFGLTEPAAGSDAVGIQ